MIKKYFVTKDSVFHKSIVLPLYEGNDQGFVIDGLSLDKRLSLFRSSVVKTTGKNRDVDLNTLPLICSIVYLDDNLNLRAFVLETNNNRNKTYYCFRCDPQNPRLVKYQTNYESNDLKKLTDDFETSGSRRKDYKGVGDFSKIKDLDYFENKYRKTTDKQINKESNVSRLILPIGNKFTDGFARLFERKELEVVNKEDVGFKVISRDSLTKNINNRKDCLLINKDTKKIEYYIYTHRPLFVNHYYLFKCLANNQYEFIKESTSFDELFLLKELKDIKYRECSLRAGKSLSSVDYFDLYKTFIEYQEDELFDEDFGNEAKIVEELQQETKDYVLSDELDELLQTFNYKDNDGILYFPDYETIPLALLDRKHIYIKADRNLNNDEFLDKISSKDLVSIKKALKNLLETQLSSRITLFEKKAKSLISDVFNKDNEEQVLRIKEVEDLYKMIWPMDFRYHAKYINGIYNQFETWKNKKRFDMAAISKAMETVNANVIVSMHASDRIDERIRVMSQEEKETLAKAAFVNGKTSIHFLEKDQSMFLYLQYKQNKYENKTLRLYEDVIFVYSSTPPHSLITCFPYQQNYEDFLKGRRMNK